MAIVMESTYPYLKGGVSAVIHDIVTALTIAYDILVGGLLVAILGGFLWKRATGAGALSSMAVGTVVTLATMAIVGDVLANEPIYYGLASSLIVYVVVSLATSRTDTAVYFAAEPKPGQQSVNGRSLSTVLGTPMQVSG